MSDDPELRKSISEDQDKKILGFGNPLLDISAQVGQEVLDEWGATLNNAILAEDKHKPLYKKLAELPNSEFIAGGATLNSIRVAQWILSAVEKPGLSSYVGCVGNDEFGDKMVAQLVKDGVKPLFMKADGVATGTCAVLVKDAERSLVANLSAAEKYSMDHFKTEEVLMAVRAADIFYMAGFPLTHEGGAAAVLEICKHAALKKKTVCMNISAPFICMVPPFRTALLECMKYCDYVFCNESEAAELSKQMEWGITDVKEIALKIASLESERQWGLKAVVTQGSNCTVIASPKTPSAEASVATFDVKGNPWTLEAAQLVDTNGAGDAFVGGFLSQLSVNADEETCVKMGHFAAGCIIQQSGCTCPEMSKVDHVL